MTKSRNLHAPAHRWTSSEEEILTRLHANTPNAEIARLLGVQIHVITGKANKMGLHKSPEYLASPAACRLRRGDNVGKAHQFKPGLVPWNKGLKGVTYAGCVSTQFKPGVRSGKAGNLLGRSNLQYKPVGAERISKDGYLERKINDEMPFQQRWRGVHLLLWESVNGPLPRGHAIVFKDGDKRNITLDNLERVTRADLMRRNSRHNHGPEISELIHLRGVITRITNRKSKHVESANATPTPV